MTGKDIPLVTWYNTGSKKKIKRPKYELKTMEEVKAIQKKLGKNASWYYGTWCDKCCEVYPAFFTEGTFEDLGYYVCLVCGKESEHKSMTWQARDAWNKGQYKWEPSAPQYKQMTIFDEWACDFLQACK